jgi:hypothetical protein
MSKICFAICSFSAQFGENSQSPISIRLAPFGEKTPSGNFGIIHLQLFLFMPGNETADVSG